MKSVRMFPFVRCSSELRGASPVYYQAHPNNASYNALSELIGAPLNKSGQEQQARGRQPLSP